MLPEGSAGGLEHRSPLSCPVGFVVYLTEEKPSERPSDLVTYVLGIFIPAREVVVSTEGTQKGKTPWKSGVNIADKLIGSLGTFSVIARLSSSPVPPVENPFGWQTLISRRCA